MSGGGAGSETDGSSPEEYLLDGPLTTLGLGRVITTHSLPAHLWSFNGKWRFGLVGFPAPGNLHGLAPFRQFYSRFVPRGRPLFSGVPRLFLFFRCIFSPCLCLPLEVVDSLGGRCLASVGVVPPPPLSEYQQKLGRGKALAPAAAPGHALDLLLDPANHDFLFFMDLYDYWYRGFTHVFLCC